MNEKALTWSGLFIGLEHPIHPGSYDGSCHDSYTGDNWQRTNNGCSLRALPL
ncbi:hypothetical protein C4K39_3347 [Pseudomonas sessilinigenes]|nr:hypothetical protein C4K39_3347 [Pseudomonas sessilinigenes]